MQLDCLHKTLPGVLPALKNSNKTEWEMLCSHHQPDRLYILHYTTIIVVTGEESVRDDCIIKRKYSINFE
jgi:hypothetical protein